MIEQIIIVGAVTSALYLVFALGLVMVYSVGRVEDLAVGMYLMVAAYIYWMLAEGGPYLSLPKGLAMLIVILIGITISIATYKGIIRRFLKNPTAVFISTLILALLVEYVITAIFTSSPRAVLPLVFGAVSIGGVLVTINILIILAISWASVIALFLFVNKTHIGKALRAVSIDRRGAMLVGISPEKMRIITWGWCGALAAIAGICFSTHTHISAEMWILPLIMAFIIVMVGGLGSIGGAILAAHIIGFVEAATMILIDERLRGVFGLILLLIILMFRHKGLFGRE
jgi:branched-chain amino acid transport system permease protein